MDEPVGGANGKATAMTLRSHIAYFLRTHIFSLRIFALSLFNLVF